MVGQHVGVQRLESRMRFQHVAARRPEGGKIAQRFRPGIAPQQPQPRELAAGGFGPVDQPLGLHPIGRVIRRAGIYMHDIEQHAA